MADIGTGQDTESKEPGTLTSLRRLRPRLVRTLKQNVPAKGTYLLKRAEVRAHQGMQETIEWHLPTENQRSGLVRKSKEQTVGYSLSEEDRGQG